MPDLAGVEALVAEGTAHLSAASIATPRREARLLFECATGIAPAAQLGNDTDLQEGAAAHYRGLVARRASGEPFARIKGTREFWSLDFALSAATLDPRPDSETLVGAVIERARKDTPLRVLDLGTGSGCLLVSILSELPLATGVGIDRSHEAVVTARGNAQRNGVGDRGTFIAGDWAQAVSGPFDIVVCNPPYIPTAQIASLAREVREHDPYGALDGGDDGLACYRRLAPEIVRILAPSGFAVLEVGHGQVESVREILAAAQLCNAGVHRDLAGIERCIVATSALSAGAKKGLD